MKGWILIERGSLRIVANAISKKTIVDKAQPIINRNPRKQYRYAKIDTTDLPWFKKGE